MHFVQEKRIIRMLNFESEVDGIFCTLAPVAKRHMFGHEDSSSTCMCVPFSNINVNLILIFEMGTHI